MKKIFIMIFCAMLLSSMVACGNKKENNKDDKENEKDSSNDENKIDDDFDF